MAMRRFSRPSAEKGPPSDRWKVDLFSCDKDSFLCRSLRKCLGFLVLVSYFKESVDHPNGYLPTLIL